MQQKLTTRRYGTAAREHLLSQQAKALEIRLRLLLQQQASRAAEIRTVERSVERLLGQLGQLSAILTTTTLPVGASVESPKPQTSSPPVRSATGQPDATPAAPPRPAVESIYCSFPPPPRRIDMSASPLGLWILSQRQRTGKKKKKLQSEEVEQTQLRTVGNLKSRSRQPRRCSP